MNKAQLNDGEGDSRMRNRKETAKAPAAAASPAEAQGQNANLAEQGNAEVSFWDSVRGPLKNILVMLLVFNVLSMFFGASTNQAQPQNQEQSSGGPADSQGGGIGGGQVAGSGSENENLTNANAASAITSLLSPYWKQGESVEFRLFVNEKDHLLANQSSETWGPVQWHVPEFTLGDPSLDLRHDLSIAAPESVLNNGSLYAHGVFSRHGYPINPADSEYKSGAVSVVTWPLVYFQVFKMPVRVQKLVELPQIHSEDAEDEARSEAQKIKTEEEQKKLDGKIIGYWYPNLTLSVIDTGDDLYPFSQEPPPVREWVRFLDGYERNPANNLTYYKPIVYVNDFWRLQENMYPVNQTTPVLPLHVNLAPLALWKFRVMCSMDYSAKNQQSGMFGEDLGSSGIDDVKRMLGNANPYLLAVTMVVSVLHSIFDFLAFKNDVQFWRKKENTVGVSVRAMLMQLAFEIIILLYLFDNRGNTSYVILTSNAVGVAIEAWKIVKALDARLVDKDCGQVDGASGSSENNNNNNNNDNDKARRKNVIQIFNKVLTIKGDEELTKDESNTREYDKIAHRYLGYIAYPLLGGYAIYSLFTQEQKSWYSFVLSVMVGYVYTFGFLMMVPQLYINYRLKSVAHMPWRTFMYKALNTFIDDLFAWVMPMPTLHRLATLRDDVVFVAYLYQRWIYGVDHTRPNEYGQVDTQALEGTGNPKEESKKTK